MKHANLFSRLLLCAAVGLIASSALAQDEKKKKDEKKEEGWVDLFNGKSLDGWYSPYDWGSFKSEQAVEGKDGKGGTPGEIQLKASKKFFVLTKKRYADFIFEGEVQVPLGKSNSGFMFRCNAEQNKVWGYQAEVDPSDRKWSGGLYDEGRRGWLHPKKGDEKSVEAFLKQGDPFKHGEWNKYRIEAVGDKIKISVNGTQVTEYQDAMDSEGYIGIQHHGEKDKVYRFRNLRIKEISPAKGEWTKLFDGKTLDGWVNGKGEAVSKGWVVEGDTLHRKEAGGDIFSKEHYKNFEMEFEWKISEAGNSGIKYRFGDHGGRKVGPEFQVLDDEKHPDGKVGNNRKTACLYDILRADTKKLVKKPGEWNKGKIIAYHDRIQHQVNGKAVLTYNLRSDAFKKGLEKSKFKGLSDFASKSGPIMLQDHKDPVWYKNLRIRKLD